MNLTTILSILLLLVPVLDAWKTKFDFLGTFKCSNPGPWCVELWYRELDASESTHDDYGRVPRMCTLGNTVVSRHIAWDADDGMFNRYYEPSVTVTHNCTGGDDKTFLHQFDDVEVYETYVPIIYEMDLSK